MLKSYLKRSAFFVILFCCILPIVGNTRAQSINVYEKSSRDSPVLIAHRGGVITENVSENTIPALELAKQRGFSMVEVDVRESRDHVPIAFHDKHLKDDIGIDTRIEDLTFEEIQELTYEKTGSTIPTLEEYLARCSELEMGIMLDIKSELRQKGKPSGISKKADATVEFYRKIAGIVKKYELGPHTITIDRHPLAQEHLKGVVMMRMTPEEEKKIRDGNPISVNDKFWFGWPRHISDNLIAVFQNQNILVVPSINVQHYPEEKHLQLAKKDIIRMIEADIDIFQIDGVYADFVNEAYKKSSL